MLSIIALLSLGIANAQNRVTGTVSATTGQPVETAIVKIMVDKSIVAYTMTEENGYYELSFKSDAKKVLLSVESMGYESFNRLISNAAQRCDIVLKEKVTELKEVVVKAPSIYQRGDTLSYNLLSYAGHDDYTLKDAMKKLPGIDVSESGNIKYLGKEISNFYIDGIDLLGGKYNIATSNIPASYVNSVQVLNNHQSVKMDEDLFSDNVAININLKNQARFKPVGTYEASVGYGDDWLYHLSGAGMLFKKNLQIISTFKAGNIFHFATGEDANLFTDANEQSYAVRLMGDLSASNPPVEIDRYASPTDYLLTFNLLKKISDNATVRGNVGYSYSKSIYDYSLQRVYYNDEGNILISQQYSPKSTLHKPNFAIEYKNNSKKNYIANRCSGFISILKSELPVLENGLMTNQKQSLYDLNLENNFSMRWRKGKLRWSASSYLQFSDAPTARLNIVNEDKGGIVQDVYNIGILSKNTLSTLREFGNSRLYFPFLLNFSADKMQTTLQADKEMEENDVRGEKFSAAFAPQYEYTAPKRKYVFRAELPLRSDYINFRNFAQANGGGNWHLSACPNLYFNYVISARSVFRTRVSYSRTFGDILDFLVSPVQTDITTQKISSGVLSDNKNFTVNLHYDYKIPLDLWFINADVIYQRNNNNLLLSQNVTTSLVQSRYSFIPNHSENIAGFVGITKQIEPINTKISVKGTYLWQKQMVEQNDNLIETVWHSVGVSPSINSRPCKFIEFDYSGIIGRTGSDYKDIKKSYWSQTHHIALKLLPVESMQITAKTDITRKELTNDIRKTMALLDLGISYKHNSMRFELSLRNALNQQSYSYTIYNSVNTYTYDYRLRGRELIFSFVFTK